MWVLSRNTQYLLPCEGIQVRKAESAGAHHTCKEDAARAMGNKLVVDTSCMQRHTMLAKHDNLGAPSQTP